MGMLDSIRGFNITSKNTEENKPTEEKYYVDKNSTTYKLFKGKGSGNLVAKPTIWNGVDLLMDTYYWEPTKNPIQFKSDNDKDCRQNELTDFKYSPVKFSEDEIKYSGWWGRMHFPSWQNKPQVDKDGWQTYPNMEVTGSAKDMELLRRRGASSTKNDPNGAAQFVEGKDNKSVKIKGDINKPDQIQITAATNGKKNIYTYRKLSKKELADKIIQIGNMQGRKLNGNYTYEFRFPLRLDAVKDYYVLESVVDEKGNDIMKKDHVEVYHLDAKVDVKNGTAQYDLVQDKDCDGSNRSSMKYSRRAK